MNVRQRKICIVIFAACLAVIAAAVLICAFVIPVDLDEASFLQSAKLPKGNMAKHESAGQVESNKDRLNLQKLLSLSAVNLRDDLFKVDQPAGPALAAMHRPISLGVTLVGTASEQGHSMAVLKKRNGKTQLYALGEKFEDSGMQIELISIEGRSVTLRSGGREYKLQMPPETGSGVVR